MMQAFPASEATFILEGPSGDLEVLTTPPQESSSTQSNHVAIICHPHPVQGGTMNNKVVTTLARTFKELGLATVRFNFRGVGKSHGIYDRGNGELEDLFAVIAWVKTVSPDALIWLGGFSFGAFIAFKAATQIKVDRLICVAPPVSRFDVNDLPVVKCPWIVIQGNQDEVVEPQAVFNWVEGIKPPKPVVIKMEGAGHFFHGQLLELRRQLTEVLNGKPEASF